MGSGNWSRRFRDFSILLKAFFFLLRTWQRCDEPTQLDFCRLFDEALKWKYFCFFSDIKEAFFLFWLFIFLFFSRLYFGQGYTPSYFQDIPCVSAIWTNFKLIWSFDLRLKAIYCPSCFKKYYSLQKWPKNNHLASFTKVKSKFMIHTVYIFWN